MPDISKMTSNVLNAYANYQAAFNELLHKVQPGDDALESQAHLQEPFFKAWQEIASSPEQLWEHGVKMANDYYSLWQNVLEQAVNSGVEPFVKQDGKDSRFQDEAWERLPAYNFIKQSYYLNQNWINDLLAKIKTLDPKEKHKLTFYTKQLIDALSPSNFLATNPVILRQTIESDAENLAKGAKNFLHDVKQSKASLAISTTDFKAFELGKNIAVTPGKVVYQNELMQLIQYSPLTEKVHKTPLIMVPAWINKYYILDLQDKNSYVRWAVEQGFTVFMVSWKNPGASLSNKSYEDYMKEGPLAAIAKVQAITKEAKVNLLGYCLGGTLVATTAAYLAAKKKDWINSLTFLTTLVDFTECGDVGVFIDEKQIEMLEKRMSKRGYLEGYEMAGTFSMLRANDMIWSFVVNNYLMGKDPFPFDILYWNADSTRLPHAMHSYYLRNMYQNNLLVKPDGITVDGVPIDLRKIKLPAYILATRDDHIAPWHAVFKAMELYKGQHRFVLSASGHVAGVVNHPSKQKYCYWVNEGDVHDYNKWFAHSKQYPGSWWLDWHMWIEGLSGELVPGRTISGKGLEDAPGSYVKERV
ncbi:MAG: class I poly(R)-hydroxyalkanoic acid synthase [Proteobacteria bacterium]|nr:class I poly(R)-hydroxyalkanoic acid synthase [Pseudomonadota bacterium]